eukprot:TRINITY_DN24689_c0_g1_i1.p1 TRINITY_DN24689_c0_g1~~TRINITY_DN24689_c0_g1_i1.p1  ORF type:complete len:177 (+),score=98.54 TRINITY_DN24689_c0_g1_i1:57-587(+)
MSGRKPMEAMQVKTMSDVKREEEKEKEKQAAKRKKEQERMAAMAQRLAAAQATISERRLGDSRRINEEERAERRKFIDVDEAESTTDDYRQAKRAKIENSEREKNEQNFADMVRKREHWESKKTRDCGEWKRGNCERGDGCKYRHPPQNHPRYNEYCTKKGGAPPSILHFMNFIST